MKLRPYQLAAIESIRRAFKKRLRALLVGPTGSGKTAVAARVVHDWNGRVLWLAHRHELIAQAHEELRRLGIAESDLGILSGMDADLPGEAAVLAALAQHPNGCAKKQLRILTGYKRSTLDAYLQRLRTADAIKADGDRFVITVAGRRKLPADWKELPKGLALRQHYLATLPSGEGAILQLLIRFHPESASRDDISRNTGFARSSRDAYIQRLKARGLAETEGKWVRAAAGLFE